MEEKNIGASSGDASTEGTKFNPKEHGEAVTMLICAIGALTILGAIYGPGFIGENFSANPIGETAVTTTVAVTEEKEISSTMAPVVDNTYKVQKGDSWYGIAEKNKVCISELLIANNFPAEYIPWNYPADSEIPDANQWKSLNEGDIIYLP